MSFTPERTSDAARRSIDSASPPSYRSVTSTITVFAGWLTSVWQ